VTIEHSSETATSGAGWSLSAGLRQKGSDSAGANWLARLKWTIPVMTFAGPSPSTWVGEYVLSVLRMREIILHILTLINKC